MHREQSPTWPLPLVTVVLLTGLLVVLLGCLAHAADQRDRQQAPLIINTLSTVETSWNGSTP